MGVHEAGDGEGVLGLLGCWEPEEEVMILILILMIVVIVMILVVTVVIRMCCCCCWGHVVGRGRSGTVMDGYIANTIAVATVVCLFMERHDHVVCCFAVISV